MTKPTFLRRNVKGDVFGDPVAYTPLLFTVGTATFRLALVRDPSNTAPDRMREWQVFCPVTGGRILRVTATYKGVPVASSFLNMAQARQCAMADLEELAGRVGSDVFCARLAGAREKYAGVAV